MKVEPCLYLSKYSKIQPLDPLACVAQICTLAYIWRMPSTCSTFECAQNRLLSFLITLCVCGCSLVKSGNGILAGCMGLFVKARMATSIGNTWQFWYVQVPDSMITLARSSLMFASD